VKGRVLAALVAAMVVGAPATAWAVPDCSTMPKARTLVSGRGTLESVISDDRGRLYFTDADAGELLRMDKRHSQPKVVIDGIRAPGGLAFLDDGSLLVGYGDAIQTATTGLENPQAGLIRYDPKTGKSAPYADGFTMANGVAVGPDGAVYGSNDVGTGIDRYLNGTVQRAWAPIASSNGLVVALNEHYMYAAQTFVPAAISRITLSDPPVVEPWFTAPQADSAAGLDGMTRDGRDRLYVAANGGGAIWRIGEDHQACALAHLPPLGPSAVAFGGAPDPKRGRKPHRFSRQNLYVTTFQGNLIQLKNVRGPEH
jgi:sugar lactone lactonase YvrE